jgi:hypothetical protein
VTTPGTRILPSGELDVLPEVIFVLVARVGGLDHVGLRTNLQDDVEDVGERHIVLVRIASIRSSRVE